MNAWTAADHPRGGGGRFKPKTHTEPEDQLEADQWMSTPITLRGGTVEWRTAHGALHREDGPAVMLPNGSKEWWVHGHKHRDDGPAITWADGTAMRRQHDNLHRIDGPAYVHPDGTEAWWRNDKRHRTDGPAIVTSKGALEWWEHGERKPPEVEKMLTLVWRSKNGETSTRK